MVKKERFERLPEYTFARLRNLLSDIPVGTNPTYMSIGEPKHPFPEFVREAILKNLDGLSKYPPNDGIETLRISICNWLSKRYNIPKLNPDKNIMVLNGTREGLFNATLALTPEQKNRKTPVVLIPNPFYQCYMAASLAAGAEPIFIPAVKENNFLPDFLNVSPEILNRTCLVFVCSPSNPQGAVASNFYWSSLIKLAEKYDFKILADECYSEIYRKNKPPGILEIANEEDFDKERVLVFNSLSKRSNLPGIRCGFVAGGQFSIRKIIQLKSYGGAPVPTPLQEVAAMVWADELHVKESLKLYQEKYQLADNMLNNFEGYTAPEAGFFIWLKVKDGEKLTLNLWKNHSIQVLPGAYLANQNHSDYSQINPGKQYIRIALVSRKEEISKSLEKVILEENLI